MNRRNAIIRISLAGTGLIASFSVYKWYEIVKAPDLSYLDKNKETIAALAESIIPATDSPGARDAKVEDFIIKMVKECTEVKSQNKFIDGLRDVKSFSLNHYNKLFEKCSPSEQELILDHFEKSEKPFGGIIGKIQRRFLGRSFFATLKAYTVEGYCTSELGATKGLSYVYIPGSFQGCIPLKPGQKAWATN